MYSDVTCIILAGGRSSRMGKDKALLRLNGKTVIERMLEIVKPVFEKIILITNKPDEFAFLGVPVYEDIYKYKGPQAGIHSGLSHSATEKNFVISCDIPLMKAEMIKYIIEYETDKKIVICRAAGYLQPLAGIYSKEILRDLENYLTEKRSPNERENKNHKNCGMHHFIDSQSPEIIYPEKLSSLNGAGFYSDELFFNMNRPEDYEYISRIFKSTE